MNAREIRRRNRRERIIRRRLIALMGGAVIVLGIIIGVLTIQLLGSTAKKKQKQVEKKQNVKVVKAVTPKPEKKKVVTEKNGIRLNLDPKKKMVALTFDDGPYTKVTRSIVNTLKKQNGRATFFVVGNRVKTYSDTLKYAHNAGNQIGNHTFSHKDLSKMTAKKMKAEIEKTNRAVKSFTGEDTQMLRPPFGNVSKTMRKNVKEPMIYWSIDSEDWKSRNVKSILKRCKNVSDGDIILMHDIYPTTASAVKKLVPKLAKKGFQFVTLKELYYYKKISLKNGSVYCSAK